jgi:phosphohistidine swiveling domain-containing protein
MKTYDTSKMHENERKVKDEAEAHVHLILSGLKKKVYLWILKHARNAVKNRENLRFLRSKSFGLSRRLFRAMANHMYKLGLINQVEDFYFLEYKEVFNFIDGKSTTLNLKDLAILRKTEFERYYAEVDPPDRFLTYGAVGTSLKDMFIINSGDLLKNKIKISDDPNLIYGVSCCPGVVRGKVKIALTVDDAADIEGEILVAKRTDPGWVPLFPSCSGLIVERGSLLSHSAVIARELGLPTIVGVSEDLLSRLKNGDEIELNATNGEIRILNVES